MAQLGYDEEQFSEAVKAIANVGGMSEDQAERALLSVLNAYGQPAEPHRFASVPFSIAEMNEGTWTGQRSPGDAVPLPEPPEPERYPADPNYHRLAREHVITTDEAMRQAERVISNPRTNGLSMGHGADALPWWASSYDDGFPAGGV